MIGFNSARCTLRGGDQAGFWPWLVVLLILLPAAANGAGEPQPFVYGSFAGLVERRGDQPFVVSFWSLDCPPCHRELKLWGELKRRHPGLALVLVSTNSPADTGKIMQLLERYGLGEVESWVFDGNVQRLRFEVDRTWQGALPRTYFFRNRRMAGAVTGVLKPAHIARWLALDP